MTQIRVGLCVLIAFSVFAHGAVEPWSEAILMIGAALLLLRWGWLGFREPSIEVHWNPLLVPLAGLVLLGGWQAVLGASAYSYLTRVELLRLTAYVFLFFLGAQVLSTSKESRGFFWFLVTLGFAAGLLGIIQHFTFNQKLYWVRELRYGGIPFGPYVNRNHFAGLMELLLPLGLALLFFRAEHRERLPLVALLTIVPAGALFLSASRGGILSFLLELGLLGSLLWARASGRRALGMATAVLLAAGAFAVWLGAEKAFARFAAARPDEVSQARRMTMMQDSWRIFRDHPWTGAGLGTLIVVYPQYASVYDGFVVDHVHNDYVELLAEGGLFGGLLGAGFLALLFGLSVSRLGQAPEGLPLAMRAGALVSCTGLLFHSLVDFNLHIPANAMLFLILAAIATSPAGKVSVIPLTKRA